MNILQKNKEKPLYEVPEQFFEQLQKNIMKRVLKEKSKEKSFKQWLSVASVAASVVLIFLLSYFLFVNRNPNELFYVHENISLQEESMLSNEVVHLAEVKEINTYEKKNDFELKNTNNKPKPLVSIPPIEYPISPAQFSETIVYRAVDYYLDDYEVIRFCDVMYDLDCYYEY